MQPHEQFAEFEIAGQIEAVKTVAVYPGLDFNIYTVRVRKFNTFSLYFPDDLVEAYDIRIGKDVHVKGSFQRPTNDSEVIFSVSEVLS